MTHPGQRIIDPSGPVPAGTEASEFLNGIATELAAMDRELEKRQLEMTRSMSALSMGRPFAAPPRHARRRIVGV